MRSLLWVIMSAVLANNLVLVKFQGLTPFLGTTGRLRSALHMSLITWGLMTAGTAITWPLQHFVIGPKGLDYMSVVIFALVIASLVQFMERVIKSLKPGILEELGIYPVLLAANSAVLGVCTDSMLESTGYGDAVFTAFGAGLGFFIAMMMFAGVQERIEDNDIPESFRGVPATLIAAAIVSLSFMGFYGIVDGIFGM